MRFNWVAQYRLGLAFVAVVLFMSIGKVSGVMLTGSAEQMKNHQDQQKSEPQQLTIILERIYLDGEMSEEVVHDSYWSIENFWSRYDQWQLVGMDESTMVFRKQEDDISPLLKANGYFGLSEDGVLTIF